MTGCPQLVRTCFEAYYGGQGGIIGTLDYTGSPNIADIRAACNTRMSNINFDGGNGSKVWHLCVWNTGLPANFDFTRFQSMKELWIWADNFSGALNMNSNVCTTLTSVQSISDTSFPQVLRKMCWVGASALPQGREEK